jgi:hypothetical protein
VRVAAGRPEPVGAGPPSAPVTVIGTPAAGAWATVAAENEHGRRGAKAGADVRMIALGTTPSTNWLSCSTSCSPAGEHQARNSFGDLAELPT